MKFSLATNFQNLEKPSVFANAICCETSLCLHFTHFNCHATKSGCFFQKVVSYATIATNIRPMPTAFVAKPVAFVTMSVAFVTMSDAFVAMSDAFVTMSVVFVTMSVVFVTMSSAFVAMSVAFVAMSIAFVAMSDAFVTMSDAFVTMSSAFVRIKFFKKLGNFHTLYITLLVSGYANSAPRKQRSFVLLYLLLTLKLEEI